MVQWLAHWTMNPKIVVQTPMEVIFLQYPDWQVLSRLSSKWVHRLFSWWKVKAARERRWRLPSLYRALNHEFANSTRPYGHWAIGYLYLYRLPVALAMEYIKNPVYRKSLSKYEKWHRNSNNFFEKESENNFSETLARKRRMPGTCRIWQCIK